MAAPLFNTLDDTPTYVENTSGVVLDDDATISDADLGPADPFTGATLTLQRDGGANPDDVFGGSGTLSLEDGQVLLVEDQAGELISVPVGSFTNSDGVLTIVFNDAATADRINTVLQQITYGNSNDVPPPSVQINYVFDNGEVATGSITVTINAVNDAPELDFVTPAAFYQPGTTGTPLSPGVTVDDPDGSTIASAAVRVGFGTFVAGDILEVDVGATGIVADYDDGIGVLTLTGLATHAQYAQVLATVTYRSTEPDPAAAGNIRIVEWEVNDGNALSALQTTTVNFTPAVDLDQSAAGNDFANSFAENGTAAAIVDSDVFVTGGTAGITFATIVLTNAEAGDSLAITGALPAALTGNIDTSVPGQITVTLIGSASAADYEAALQQIAFSNSSDDPDTTARNVTVVLGNDDSSGNPAQAVITINPLNDGPVNTLPASAAGPGAISGLAVSDVDVGVGLLTTMLHVENGALTVGSAGGAVVAGSGTDTVTLTGTLAQINTTLSAGNNVRYNSEGGFVGTDTLTMTTSDNGNSGAGGALIDTDLMSILVRSSVNKNDFDGDGRSDILWRHDAGTVVSWELDSGTILHFHNFGHVDTVYTVEAIADFNGDGSADILWRHDAGFVITWEVNHGDVIGYHPIGPTDPANVIEGTGDFNADGKADILWRNADTGVVSWELDGNVVSGTKDFGPVPADYDIVGTGDVNGDGTTDIFWRHSSGQLVSWEIVNGAIVDFNDYGHVPTDFEFAGTGDFNGDGNSGDIVWRHVTGQVVTWELDGDTLIGFHDFGTVTTDYTIEDTGDYNGDGMSDILWRHDSGLPITWELDSGSIIGYHAFDPVDPVWQIQPPV